MADGFEYSEKCADGDETRKVFAGRVQGESRAPEDYVDAEVFGYGDSLEDPVGRILDAEDCYVDACCEPGVL